MHPNEKDLVPCMKNNKIVKKISGIRKQEIWSYFSDKDIGRKQKSFQIETWERNGHLLHVGKHGLPKPHLDFFPFYGAGAQNGGHLSKNDIEIAGKAMDLWGPYW